MNVKRLLFLPASLLLMLFSLTLSACGDDDGDDDDVTSGGNIVGTWHCDLDLDTSSEYGTWTIDDYYVFQSDGSYYNVCIETYSGEYKERYGNGKSKSVTVDKGTWKTSGSHVTLIINESGDGSTEDLGVPSTCGYSVKGDKLTLTNETGIVFSVTCTRVSDSTVSKYLK